MPAKAEVRVFIQDTNGMALLCYECTGGELIRAFALDVTVDRGKIVGVSDFLRGPSTVGATGYGIFPASYRDHLLGGSTTNINIDWQSPDYTPLADPADAPADTQPGLGSAGVTLEFGAVWEPATPGAMPGPTGKLCELQLSQAAIVSVSPNNLRGGVVSAVTGSPVQSAFVGAAIGPGIISATLQSGSVTVLFQGGELQGAPSLGGPWTGTGNSSGSYSEPFEPGQSRFFRVRSP